MPRKPNHRPLFRAKQSVSATNEKKCGGCNSKTPAAPPTPENPCPDCIQRRINAARLALESVGKQLAEAEQLAIASGYTTSAAAIGEARALWLAHGEQPDFARLLAPFTATPAEPPKRAE